MRAWTMISKMMIQMVDRSMLPFRHLRRYRDIVGVYPFLLGRVVVSGWMSRGSIVPFHLFNSYQSHASDYHDYRLHRVRPCHRARPGHVREGGRDPPIEVLNLSIPLYLQAIFVLLSPSPPPSTSPSLPLSSALLDPDPDPNPRSSTHIHPFTNSLPLPSSATTTTSSLAKKA